MGGAEWYLESENGMGMLCGRSCRVVGISVAREFHVVGVGANVWPLKYYLGGIGRSLVREVDQS